jgi:pentose-5-phosphate-3-epimerase
VKAPSVIAASILSCEFARLGEAVRDVIAAGASVPFDVHLMVRPVDAMAETFTRAGVGLMCSGMATASSRDFHQMYLRVNSCNDSGLI